MRALVVANSDDDDAGFVGRRFGEHGYHFENCRREQPGTWPALDGAELILLLGSDWSVYWPQVRERVAAEAALLREAHRRRVPVFAICYGSQLVAHALGGSVGPSHEPEIGWFEIDTDVPDAIAAGPWMQWHSDAVTLPAGAVELARSPVCPQAFAVGRTVGVQFHPEVTAEVVDRWLSGSSAAQLAREGLDVAGIRRAAPAALARSEANAYRLVDWFVTTVVGSPMAAAPVLEIGPQAAV